MNLAGCRRLCALAREEFADIVLDARDIETNELRILLVDGSSIDVWYSLKLVGRYSYHWERRAIDGTIYRHDNAPHARWRGVSTFPKHYHDGDEYVVVESRLSVAGGRPAPVPRLRQRKTARPLNRHRSRPDALPAMR